MGIVSAEAKRIKKKRKNAKGPKTKKAVLKNYLFLPKSVVKSSDEFSDMFEYELDMSNSSHARVAREQIEFMRKSIEEDGFDADEILAEYDENQTVTIRNWQDAGKWWAVCRGDRRKVKKLIKRLGLKVKDKRIVAPLDFKGLKMKVNLRDSQVEPFEVWNKKRYGILRAAPAFGKTVVSINTILNLGQQTLVLVHTDALAKQYITRFRDGFQAEDGNWVPITNCKKIEKKIGREIIGRYKPKNPFYPITVATYQAFIKNKHTWKAFKELQKNFGLVLCDEAHRAAAPTYARVINACEARWRMGMTATPERKDEMEVGVFDIIGPVTAIGSAKQMPIDAYLHQTGYTYHPSKYPGRGEWVRMVNKLLESSQRNKYILDWLVHDIENNRNVLMIAARVGWCKDMAEKITRGLGIPAGIAIGGASKKDKEKREIVIREMLDRKIRVICATKVMDEGVDIANLDTLYIVDPMNNKPTLEQRLGRVRRHYDNKEHPIVRYFVDDGFGALFGCAKGTQSHLSELEVPVHYVSKAMHEEMLKKTKKKEKKREKTVIRRKNKEKKKRVTVNSGGFKQAEASRARSSKVKSLFNDANEHEMQFSSYNKRARSKKKKQGKKK